MLRRYQSAILWRSDPVHLAPSLKAAFCAIAALFLLAPGANDATAMGAGERTERVTGGELLAFTAISLKEVLRDAIEAFEGRHPGITLRLHAGASGLLARQIEHGLEIDRLQEAGLLRPGSRVAFAGNRMVIAVARGTEPPGTFGDLADARFDRIAIGNPRTVPAGRYAAEALRSQGLHDTIAPRLVPAENARQVLDYVVRGETAAGLVYRTDARLAAGKIVVGPEAPANAHAPIIYEAAVPRDTEAHDAALLFLDFLTSEQGQAILSRFGFLPAPAR
jgi:molybdate transport system substrate-binding protein